MRKNYLVSGIIIGLAVLAAAYISVSSYQSQKSAARGALDGFVQCIANKGIIFYGAFWCPHCQRTKAEFGDSALKLPYVECSTPDGEHQTQACIDKNIREYPTWLLPDGTRVSGEHTLRELSDAFQCPLPGANASSTPVAPSASSAAK